MWSAPKKCNPCAWPFLRSRGSTRRSEAQPLGDERLESVQVGNCIAARTLVILLVVAALQCWAILEQPKGSIMESHPAFQEYLSMVETWRAHILMKTYGGPTAKPTWLYSSRPEIEEINNFRPVRTPAVQEPMEMVIHYKDAKGRDKIKGGRHLKQSQSYPKGFLFLEIKQTCFQMLRGF